jgi:hypothetical protein
VPLRELAHLRLHHAAQGEKGAAELRLGQAKQEVGLVLGAVGGTLEQPASQPLVKLHTCVVAGGQGVGTNLLGHNQ